MKETRKNSLGAVGTNRCCLVFSNDRRGYIMYYNCYHHQYHYHALNDMNVTATQPPQLQQVYDFFVDRVLTATP